MKCPRPALAVFLSTAFFAAGCATGGSSSGAPATGRTWAELVGDGGVMIAGESEFSICFPGESGDAVQTYTAASLGGGRYKAWAHSSRRAVKDTDLTAAQYEELVGSLKRVDYAALEAGEQGACEKFTLKIKAAGREGRFEGCRRGGRNASELSRLAHKTEFLLLSKPGR